MGDARDMLISMQTNTLIELRADLARLRAENEALRLTASVEQQKIEYRDKLIAKLEARAAAAEAKAARLETALAEIRDLRERPYTEFPSDWTAQIAACSECQSYRGHPIQQGICNQHRKPLYARDGHDAHETSILGIRARDIARAALEAKP